MDGVIAERISKSCTHTQGLSEMLHPKLSNTFATGELCKLTKLSLPSWFCIVYYLQFHFQAIPFVAWMEREEALTSFDFLNKRYSNYYVRVFSVK